MSHWQSKEMEATKLEAGEAKYLYNTFIHSHQEPMVPFV